MAPIHDAAHSADFNALRRLLDAGVSPNDRSGILPTGNSPETPTILVCCSGSVTGDRMACLRLLRDTGANLGATDIIGYTPLHHSALNSDVEIVSLLIQAGVNLNARAHDGSTPLHLVQHVRNARAFDCCELLLKAGAAVNLTTQYGWTPLDIAINRRHYRRWPLLLRAGAEFNKNHGPVCYFVRVKSAGGFKKYEQAHLARLTAILETPLLPPELVRKILEFWLHAGYYCYY